MAFGRQIFIKTLRSRKERTWGGCRFCCFLLSFSRTLGRSCYDSRSSFHHFHQNEYCLIQNQGKVLRVSVICCKNVHWDISHTAEDNFVCINCYCTTERHAKIVKLMFISSLAFTKGTYLVSPACPRTRPAERWWLPGQPWTPWMSPVGWPFQPKTAARNVLFSWNLTVRNRCMI